MAVTDIAASETMPTPAPRLKNRVFRVVIALTLVAIGVALVVMNFSTRQLEAAMAAWVAAHTFADGSATAISLNSPSFAFGLDGTWKLLRITTECAISFVIAPLLVMFAAFCLVQRFALARIGIALVISVVALVAVNQARFLVIAISFAKGGHEAYDVAHSFTGSIIMFVGIAATVIMSILIVARPKKGRRARRH
ncbi:exosortase R [Leifsonia aquatica]|uniref:exosortase R n=1 Tax=Leifsonia aquatica TaxID=144185 RepID=UPI003808DB77